MKMTTKKAKKKPKVGRAQSKTLYDKCNCGRPKTKESGQCASCRVKEQILVKKRSVRKHGDPFWEYLPKDKRDRFLDLKRRKGSGESLNESDFLFYKQISAIGRNYNRNPRGKSIQFIELNTLRM